MLFFIRESGENGNKKKIKIYNKKQITIGIDPDPINQLVFDVQTGYNHQVQWFSTASNFSSQLRYLQLQTKLTAASENYLHASDIQRPTFISSSTKVFIGEMRRWDERKDI